MLSDEQKRARYDAMRSGNPFAGAPTASPYGGGYAGSAGYGNPFLRAAFLWRRLGPAASRAGCLQSRERAPMWSSISNSTPGRPRAVPARPSATRASIPVVTAEARVLSPPSMHIPVRAAAVAAISTSTCPFCLVRARSSRSAPSAVVPVKVVADPCPDCGGSGRTRITSEQTIEFPAGTHDGDEVRISGMGHAGTNGAAGGALVGRAHVEAERLEGKARTGFYLMGIVAPFLVLSAISGVFSAFAVMCFIPFTMGLFHGAFGRCASSQPAVVEARCDAVCQRFCQRLHVRARVGLVRKLLATGHAFAVPNAITSNPLFAAAPAWV